MPRFIGLSVDKGKGGGGLGPTEPYDRSVGFRTDSNNNVTKIEIGDFKYSDVQYNAVGLITGYNETFGGSTKGWVLTYDSQNLIDEVTERATIHPPSPEATVTAAATNIDEGSALQFTVNTTNFSSGDLYWGLSGVSTSSITSDFNGTTGIVTITSSTGTFHASPTEDSTTEGAETFKAIVYSDASRTKDIGNSDAVTINDTSIQSEITSMTVVTHTSGGDGNTATVTAPGGIQAGDLLIIMEYGPDVTSNINGQIPTGFTKITDAQHAAVDQRIHYKIAAGTESGTTYTGQTGSNENMWIGVFRGNIAITSVNVLASYGNFDTTSPSISMGSNNPSSGKQLIFVSNGTRSASTCSVNPSDPSSGWTTYDHIESGNGNEVQGIAWNFPGTSWNGVVNCSGSYGSSSRNTIIGCILDLNS